MPPFVGSEEELHALALWLGFVVSDESACTAGNAGRRSRRHPRRCVGLAGAAHLDIRPAPSAQAAPHGQRPDDRLGRGDGQDEAQRGPSCVWPAGAPLLPSVTAYAITLGVAPLLFVQLLYGQFFYSSSALRLGWAWLALIGLLLVVYAGFSGTRAAGSRCAHPDACWEWRRWCPAWLSSP